METLVLVLTDAQGSTRLWAQEPDAMDAAMQRHHEILHGAIATHGGFRPPDQGEGDAVFSAFASPVAAMQAVVQMQRELADEMWPTSQALRVRIGVHVGEVRVREGNLFGDPVNRCARIRGLATGGQTLISAAMFELVRDRLPAGSALRDLGEHRMKDLNRPEHIHQLDLAGLEHNFPPLASLDRVRHNLPVHVTPFVGREQDLSRVVASVRAHRLTTVVGFGGMGKTRLALQAAAELTAGDAIDNKTGDVWFVDLTTEIDPTVVPARVAEAAGVKYESDPIAALVEAYRDTSALIVLDNLEQVLGCASFIADLLTRTSGVRMLTTSREALRVRAEHLHILHPMTLPNADTDDGSMTPQTLSGYEAVRFFLDRATAVKPEFTITTANAPAVAAICSKLDGHPLALELAAARLRMITPEALLARLDSALQVLTGGSRDMPTRHQTLRATIAWSYDTLTLDEQTLLTRLSALPAPADYELIETVYGEGFNVFDLLESLLDRSMIRSYEPDDTHADTRYGLLTAIGDYAAEQLDPTVAHQLAENHADLIRLNFERADQQAKTALVTGGWLAHTRAALSHRAVTGNQRYVDLIVAIENNLAWAGLGAESLDHVRRALSYATAHSDRARLLGILLQCTSSDFDANAGVAREGFDEALASGSAELISEAINRLIMFSLEPGAELLEMQSLFERTIAKVPLGAERDYIEEDFANCMSVKLREHDPATAERLLREQLRRSPRSGFILQKLAPILLDDGRHQQARELFDPPGGVDWDGVELGRNLGDAVLAQAELASGNRDVAVRIAESAALFLRRSHFDDSSAVRVLADAARLDDHPEAVISAVDIAWIIVNNPTSMSAATLQWRRGRALHELGRTADAKADLGAARAILETHPWRAARELLGCLAATAVLAHRDHPEAAAEILGTIIARRGRWVLPHYADRDIATVSSFLSHFPE